jgi:hypothetical protein
MRGVVQQYRAGHLLNPGCADLAAALNPSHLLRLLLLLLLLLG